MNRGTALKWVEMLNSGNYNIDYNQCYLRVKNYVKEDSLWINVEDSFDPFGVLCDLLDREGWKSPNSEWFAYTWNGESGIIPNSMLKKGKIKSSDFNFTDEYGKSQSLIEIGSLKKFYGNVVKKNDFHVEKYESYDIEVSRVSNYTITKTMLFSNIIEKYYEQF